MTLNLKNIEEVKVLKVVDIEQFKDKVIVPLNCVINAVKTKKYNDDTILNFDLLYEINKKKYILPNLLSFSISSTLGLTFFKEFLNQILSKKELENENFDPVDLEGLYLTTTLRKNVNEKYDKMNPKSNKFYITLDNVKKFQPKSENT